MWRYTARRFATLPVRLSQSRMSAPVVASRCCTGSFEPGTRAAAGAVAGASAHRSTSRSPRHPQRHPASVHPVEDRHHGLDPLHGMRRPTSAANNFGFYYPELCYEADTHAELSVRGPVISMAGAWSDDVYAQLAQYQRLYGGHLYLYKPKEAQDLFYVVNYDDAGSRTRSRPTASTAAPASPRMTCSTRSSTRASGRPRRAAGDAHWHISLARG